MFLTYGKWGGADSETPVRYHTKRIIQHLVGLGHEEMGEQDFRRNIIGPLRDEGILISANKDGYMLATTLAEIEDFLGHGETIIFPMISRIDTAAKTIRMATAGGCDILGTPEHRGLKSIVERINDLRFEQTSTSEEVEDEDLLA